MDTNETMAAGEIGTNVNVALWASTHGKEQPWICMPTMIARGASITAHSLLPSFST
jgi:hypothetical protein